MNNLQESLEASWMSSCAATTTVAAFTPPANAKQTASRPRQTPAVPRTRFPLDTAIHVVYNYQISINMLKPHNEMLCDGKRNSQSPTPARQVRSLGGSCLAPGADAPNEPNFQPPWAKNQHRRDKESQSGPNVGDWGGESVHAGPVTARNVKRSQFPSSPSHQGHPNAHKYNL
jgi:hypothetical protein